MSRYLATYLYPDAKHDNFTTCCACRGDKAGLDVGHNYKRLTTLLFCLHRKCYITNDAINNRRSDFLRVLNASYRVGCLQCSFTDKEVIEFIQNKKRLTQIPKKYALQVVGKQSRGEWNLGGFFCISSSGTLMDELECENIWISDVHVGSGIPLASEQCKVVPPLSTNTLSPLLETLEARLGHNFYPAILCIASTGMCLHYQQFIQKMRYFPIPVAFGPSGTCKTTALESALSLLGAQKRVFSKITKEKVYEICCNSGGIPIGIDDPHSQVDINIYLYNGKRGGSVGKGETQPNCTAIIAANFSPCDQARFVPI